MRIEGFREFPRYIMIFFMIMVLMSCCFTLRLSGEEQRSLFIVIYDVESSSNIPLQGNLFYEGKDYEIVVGYENQTERGIAHNVTVRVPWADPYFIGIDPPSVVITAPLFEDYHQFVITAEKEGYIPAEKEVVIIKGVLSITTDKGIVEEEESFQVTVTDQNENAIEGSLVYLDVDGVDFGSETTNTNGIAYLEAPIVEDNIDVSVIAFKDGYEAASSSVRVENIQQQSFLDEFIPILIPVSILIFAMVFVRYRKQLSHATPDSSADVPRQRRGLFKQKKKKSHDMEMIHSEIDEKLDLSKLEKGPRVEEIRIPKKEKGITSDQPMDEGQPEVKIGAHKKEEYEWFKGTDHMKHKIDELTDEADIKKADRWFEGVPDLESKVDETLKKKQKEKKKK